MRARVGDAREQQRVLKDDEGLGDGAVGHVRLGRDVAEICESPVHAVRQREHLLHLDAHDLDEVLQDLGGGAGDGALERSGGGGGEHEEGAILEASLGVEARVHVDVHLTERVDVDPEALRDAHGRLVLLGQVLPARWIMVQGLRKRDKHPRGIVAQHTIATPCPRNSRPRHGSGHGGGGRPGGTHDGAPGRGAQLDREVAAGGYGGGLLLPRGEGHGAERAREGACGACGREGGEECGLGSRTGCFVLFGEALAVRQLLLLVLEPLDQLVLACLPPVHQPLQQDLDALVCVE
mmetsp:Transcript_11305/g.27729  ORF Transcript_11305/g.27729 Transcript_11305/m.27729 type:complete len:293 (+) Transcript_11305:593-1471(+)